RDLRSDVLRFAAAELGLLLERVLELAVVVEDRLDLRTDALRFALAEPGLLLEGLLELAVLLEDRLDLSLEHRELLRHALQSGELLLVAFRELRHGGEPVIVAGEPADRRGELALGGLSPLRQGGESHRHVVRVLALAARLASQIAFEL